MQENFSKKIISVLILLTIFAVMFELNNLMPLHRDDYDYSLIWKTGEHIIFLVLFAIVSPVLAKKF